MGPPSKANTVSRHQMKSHIEGQGFELGSVLVGKVFVGFIGSSVQAH